MTVTLRSMLILVVLVIGGRPLHAQTPQKYQYKKGDTLQYVLSVGQKGTIKGGGMEFTGAQKQVIEMSWQVESLDDKGNARIALKFHRVKLSAESAKESREVSSDAREEPSDEVGKGMYALAKALAKFEAVFALSPTGEVQSVTVADAVLKALKSAPGAESATEAWAAENLENTLKNNLLAFPATAIARGKAWKNPVMGASPFGKISGETLFTYDGTVTRDGRMVEKFGIKPKLTIETDPKAPVVFTIKLYESDGTAYFDNTAGRLVELTSTQRTEVEAESDGKKFSQKTESTNSFKLVKSGK